MNFKKFESAPDSVLKDVTPKVEIPAEKPPVVAAPEKSSTTIDDILKGNSNTVVSPVSLDTGTQQQQPIAGQAVQQPQNNNVSIGQMLEAKLAIELMDALLPGLFVAIFHAIEIKLRKTELQLTQKEKDTITPIMQKCLDTIMLNFSSPWTTLAVTCAIIYGSKLTEKGVVSWIDNMNEKKEMEALQEKTGIGKKNGSIIAAIKKDEEKKKEEIINSPVPQPSAIVQELIPDINVINTNNTSLYGEQEIREVMKAKNYGRQRAINWLNKKLGVNA